VPLRARPAKPRRGDASPPPPPPGDDAGAAGIREGDDGDFLYEKVWVPAHDFAFESVGDHEANVIADKIMDSVALQRRADPTFLDDDKRRRSYLLRAVVNEMKAAHRTNQIHVKLHAMYAQLIATNTTGAAIPAPDAVRLREMEEHEKSELMLYVSHAVAGLADKCQEVVYLTYAEDLWPREISERLGIKPDSVRSHLRRAEEKVRDAVRQYLIDHLPENKS
jgi:RNA polymerase sigma factor (sigma-70 family)